jgi:hypothetical protein
VIAAALKVAETVVVSKAEIVVETVAALKAAIAVATEVEIVAALRAATTKVAANLSAIKNHAHLTTAKKSHSTAKTKL